MRRSIVLILLSLAITSPATTHAQPAGPDAADVRYREGNVAFKAKRYAEAKAAYEDAFRLKQTFDIAANLGFAEIKLEQWRDAATHLSFALRIWAPTGKAESRVSAVEYLAGAKQNVATLVVTVAAGAEVTIDGKGVGVAPVDELFVEPGTHTVGARREGFDPVEKTVSAEKGKRLPVSLTLVAAAAPPRASATVPVPSASASAPPTAPTATGAPITAPPGRGPNRAVLIAGGSVAGTALVVGAVFAGLATSKAGSAANERAAIIKAGGPSACGAPPSCQGLRDLMLDQATFGNVAAWSFIGAGVVGAATVIYAVAAPKAAKAQDVRVVPVVTQQSAGLAVGGRW